MRKKRNSERVSELTTIFKEMHIKHSKEWINNYNKSNFFLIPLNHLDYNEEWNKIFVAEIKPLLLNLRRESEDEGLIFLTFLFNMSKGKLGEIRGNNLELEEYLTTIVEKSNSYFYYLSILIESGYKYFDWNDLTSFSTKYMFNEYIGLDVTVEIKEIKIKKPYITIKEKKTFDDIEYYWKIKNYEKVYFQSYAILAKLIQWFLGKPIKDKKTDIPASLEWILSDHQILKLDPTLKEIIKKFDGIIKDFGKMRNMLGKQEGETEKNEEWISAFENSSIINQKVCSRITIDLLKTLHNAILISKSTKKNNLT